MKMKTIAALSLAVVIAFAISGCASDSGSASGAASSSRSASVPDVPTVSVDEAYKLIEDNANNTNFKVIDVRTPEEYVLGHIENSLNIDYYAESFTQTVDELDKNDTYLVYCRCGTRGAHSVDIMQNLGFSNVQNMQDGYLEWQFRKFPWVK